MYDGVTTGVKTPRNKTKDLTVGIILHQVPLSPYLFTLVLDVLTSDIQKSIPNCLLFVDDIVVI